MTYGCMWGIIKRKLSKRQFKEREKERERDRKLIKEVSGIRKNSAKL